MPHWLVAASTLGFGVLLAQTDGTRAVPVANEPSHHQVLANDFVRVFHVQIPPHGSTLLHQHDRDYVVVHLTSADVTNAPAGGETRQSHVEAGGVQLVKGPLKHVVANVGDKPYENITIAILKSSPQHPPGAVRMVNLAGEGVVPRLLFENDLVRAWDVQIEPGGVQPHHVHQLPYLAIAITDLNLKNVPDKGPPETMSRKPGELSWMNAPFGHTLTNVSDRPAHFIALEFK